MKSEAEIVEEIKQLKAAQADFVAKANEQLAFFNGKITALEELIRPVEKKEEIVNG